MDPNSRMLIRVQLSDLENDEKIFQLLRGGSPIDLSERKKMVRNSKVDKELIDT